MDLQYRFALLDLNHAIDRVRWSYRALIETDPRARLTSNDVLLSDYAGRAQACALTLLDEDSDRRTRRRTETSAGAARTDGASAPAHHSTSRHAAAAGEESLGRSSAGTVPRRRPAYTPLKQAYERLKTQMGNAAGPAPPPPAPPRVEPPPLAPDEFDAFDHGDVDPFAPLDTDADDSGEDEVAREEDDDTRPSAAVRRRRSPR